MRYQFESRIRYSEVGEDYKLTLPGLIDYFQDCSTFQSEQLEVGVRKMRGMQRAWILASWQIEIDRYPILGEKISTETWIYRFKGFYGERNFRMLDAGGKELARAASLWVYYDMERSRPCKLDKDLIAVYELEDALPMTPLVRKLQMPEDSERRECFTVTRSHIDANHHVNNGQYLVMAQEYFPADWEIHRVRVEYKKAAVLHNVIVPFVCRDENKCTVSLCAESGEPYAVVEVSC